VASGRSARKPLGEGLDLSALERDLVDLVREKRTNSQGEHRSQRKGEKETHSLEKRVVVHLSLLLEEGVDLLSGIDALQL
jgi:hypothetical protein